MKNVRNKRSAQIVCDTREMRQVNKCLPHTHTRTHIGTHTLTHNIYLDIFLYINGAWNSFGMCRGRQPISM